MELFLIRHPETIGADGRCIGQTDLATGSYTIAPGLLEYLTARPISRIYSSDLQRCSLFARQLQKHTGLDLELSADLREINFGDWENRIWDEIVQNDTTVESWFADPESVSPPNGESGHQFMRRINQFLHRLPESSGTVLLVTHAGWIRSVIAGILNLSVKDSFQVKIENMSLSVIEWNFDKAPAAIQAANKLF